jgi:poly-gamma-glutamate synthesis protein (capsule biosynthesis protein)
VATIHGRRVAVLGATQVLDAYATTAWAAGESTRACVCEGRGRRPAPAVDAIRRAAAHADTVVVMLHWGREKEQCPLPRQQRLVEQLRVAGTPTCSPAAGISVTRSSTTGWATSWSRWRVGRRPPAGC